MSFFSRSVFDMNVFLHTYAEIACICLQAGGTVKKWDRHIFTLM